MTTYQLFVENIKCEGCINKIQTNLLKLKGVISVDIIQAEGKVCVSGMSIERGALVKKLNDLGYPEKGKNSFLSRAKSFVNRSIGN